MIVCRENNNLDGCGFLNLGSLPLIKTKVMGPCIYYFKFMGNYLEKIIFSTRLKTCFSNRNIAFIFGLIYL